MQRTAYLLRPLLRSTTPARLGQVTRNASRLASPSIAARSGPSSRSSLRDTSLIFASFALLTYGFSHLAPSALRLDTSAPGPLMGGATDGESEFLFATGGKVRDVSNIADCPVYSRDEVTVVMMVGGPRSGKTSQAKLIEKRFDMQFEAADSDIYSDIALALPTAAFSNPHGSSKLRIVVDDFARTSPDPLAQALDFEKNIAPILLFVFVDCPLSDTLKRAKDDADRAAITAEYADYEARYRPLIKHYRNQGNFLEITGQWPLNEQWEQVEAKLESCLELEARGDL